MFGILASSQDWFKNLRPWVDLNVGQSWLFAGTLTGEQRTNLAVAVTIWLLLPGLVGLRMAMRSEVK